MKNALFKCHNVMSKSLTDIKLTIYKHLTFLAQNKQTTGKRQKLRKSCHMFSVLLRIPPRRLNNDICIHVSVSLLMDRIENIWHTRVWQMVVNKYISFGSVYKYR